jgi:predicted RNA methylase
VRSRTIRNSGYRSDESIDRIRHPVQLVPVAFAESTARAPLTCVRSGRSTLAKTIRTAIDLFSGCGGLTLGLKKAGVEVIGAIEIDVRAREAYRANHPEVDFLANDTRIILLPDRAE